VLRLALDQLDHRPSGRHWAARRTAPRPPLLAEFELADAERGGLELELGDREQVLGGIGQQAEAVDHLDLQLAQRVRVARAADALVQGQARVHVGQVVVGDQRRHVQFDSAPWWSWAVDVGSLPCLMRAPRVPAARCTG
jgi:hypothetical protein